MIGLVVTGHGHFADGIHTSAQMIAGENEYVRYINFEEGMSPEQLAEEFNAAFDEFRTCDGVTLAVIMGVIGLILYAISAKNMRNKRKELGEVHTDMKVGSRIMFAGGIYGKIVSMEDEDTLRVEVAPKIVITISRYAVQSIVK